MKYQPYIEIMFSVQACGETAPSYFIGANKVTKEEWEAKTKPEQWWL